MKKNDQTSPLLFTPHFDYQLEEDDSYLSTTCISAKMIENAKAMLDLDVRPLDTDKSRVEQIAQCSLQISDEFKRCLPCQFLGKGRFGWVEESLDSKRAIKRPNDNDNAYMHLENEMKALKHVSKHHNKHIIELLDYCTDQKNMSIEMPKCYGSLDKFMNKNNIDCEEKFKKLVKGLVFAVAAIHTPIEQKLVVHRDIRLENVLVKIDESGEPFLILADFGGSLIIHESECDDKQKEDIWSVGCVVDEMWEKYNGASTFPSNIGNELNDFLNCCFNKEMKERWSAKQLLNHKFLN